jgi:tetratricopeptide (TPR) repeat protein
MSVIAEQNRQAELRRVILRNEQIKLAGVLKINNLDSLKQQLKVSASDTVKALIYTRIALKYLDYDTISNNQKRLYYQNQAINYTLQAIRQYSIYNDSTALRISFDHLAKVYASQQKYSQAKWFILQSNTLSRAKNDTPNIISSLLTLATIKSDINDNDLAMRDLDEALQLSITTRSPKTETEILKNYALLYSKLQNYPKEAMVLKKRDSLLDSIRKSDEAQLAKAALRAKTDSLQNKKKVFSSNIRKLYKNSSSRKIASL